MRLTSRTLIAGLVAAAVMAIAPIASATVFQTGGSTGMFLLAGALANKYHQLHPGTRITVAGGGSGAGISGVCGTISSSTCQGSGSFAIGNSSRGPSSGDISGKQGLKFTAISYEPIVVIVNKNARITSLTEAQVKGIWEGTYTNWSQVGGGNCTIKVYSRLAGSGTLSTFLSAQSGGFGGFNISSDTHSTKYGSNGLVRAAVANQPCGIGFVTYAYTVGSAASGIKGVAIGGVAPTLANTQSDRYHWAGYQYFVTVGTPSGDLATYINWARTSTVAKSIIQRFALVAPSGHDLTT